MRSMLKTAAALSLTLLMPVVAHADALDYTYVDLGYTYFSPAELSFFNQSYAIRKTHGLDLDAAYSLPDNFFLVGDYSRSRIADASINAPEYDVVRGYTVGLGYHFAVTARIDLVPVLSFGRRFTTAQISGLPSPYFSSDYTYDASERDVGLRMRAQLIDRIEFDVAYFQQRLQGSPFTEPSFSDRSSLGLVYDFTSHLAAGIDYLHDASQGQSQNGYKLFFRYDF